MKPLYCFRADEQLNLERIVIPDYRVHKLSQYSDKHTYSWDKPDVTRSKSRYVIEDKKLDRYANDKIFTFVDDIDRAYKIMYEQILNDLNVVEKRRSNLSCKYTKLCYNHPELLREVNNENN